MDAKPLKECLNQLSEIDHLLVVLAEECAEVAQRVAKALRFGLTEVQPGQPYTNAERIVNEVNDLIAVVMMLERHGLPRYGSMAAINAKQAKVALYRDYANGRTSHPEPFGLSCSPAAQAALAACDRLTPERSGISEGKTLRALVDAAENAQCACTLRERESGHLVGCWRPDLSEAIARAKIELGLEEAK